MHIRSFITSVTNALSGLSYVLRHEQNFRIQVGVSFFLLILMWIVPLSHAERMLVVLLIMLILVLELINSSIEKFTDIVKPRLHMHVKMVKDIMAGTVLIAGLGAVILGLMIFLPHIIELVHQKWYNM